MVDVGCGPGNSTELLTARWPEADVLGLDTSETMLAEARKRLPGAVRAAMPRPGCPSGTGVVFANAVYQWIPRHKQQFARIVESAEPGAVLAVQMPDNLMQPLHVLMREVAARPAFAKKLAGAPRGPLPKVGAYYDALAPHARRVDIWHTVYNHVMDDAGGSSSGSEEPASIRSCSGSMPGSRPRSSLPTAQRSRRPIPDRRTARC